MGRRIALLLVSLLVPCALQAQVTIQHGNTLSDLINNLYGGDGIQLADTGHQAHFGQTGDLQAFTRTLQSVLQARSFFPIPSAVGLVSYHFDETTGTYQRIQGALGPVLSERGSTTGKGNLNLSFSYTFADYQQIAGNDTAELVLPHCLTVACTGGHSDAAYLNDTIHVQLHFRLKSQALTFAAVYGVSNNFDLGLVVPYERNDLQVFTHAFVVVSPGSSPAIHHFDPTVETPDQSGTGTAVGIGDITARGKYRLPLHGVDSAAMVDLTLPTGDKENFLGTGHTRLRASYIASKSLKRFTPHLNAGYEVEFGQTKLDAFAYTLGTEILASPKLTLTTDLIGVVRPRGADAFVSPVLPNVQLVGRSEIDGALGGKWKLGVDRAFLFNLLLPLNKTGIRPLYVVTAGLQGTM
ncbi:MAG TPA: hypothetical protein VKH35_10520 [Thermoanaerobaculia bacterium]|nr:hypothetical protein [Thermoanaerobaculia bacterium]